MKSYDVTKTVLMFLFEAKCAEWRSDKDANAPAMKSSKRIFESNTELADDSGRRIQLLFIFVQGKVLDLETAPKIPNMPIAPAVFGNLYLGSIRDDLFVKRIGDDFSQGVFNFPIFQDFFDVEVKCSYCHTNSEEEATFVRAS